MNKSIKTLFLIGLLTLISCGREGSRQVDGAQLESNDSELLTVAKIKMAARGTVASPSPSPTPGKIVKGAILVGDKGKHKEFKCLEWDLVIKSSSTIKLIDGVKLENSKGSRQNDIVKQADGQTIQVITKTGGGKDGARFSVPEGSQISIIGQVQVCGSNEKQAICIERKATHGQFAFDQDTLSGKVKGSLYR